MKIINKIKLRLKFIITTIKLYKARWNDKRNGKDGNSRIEFPSFLFLKKVKKGISKKSKKGDCKRKKEMVELIHKVAELPKVILMDEFVHFNSQL